MSNCVACGGFSGRREICHECAVICWPRQVLNPGAKMLARALLPVNSHPVMTIPPPVHNPVSELLVT
jgi:hypothetical protein